MKEEVLDLRGVACPYTFVRTKLRLEEMSSGKKLIVILDDAGAAENVSRSLKCEGHDVLSAGKASEGLWEIWVEKA